MVAKAVLGWEAPSMQPGLCSNMKEKSNLRLILIVLLPFWVVSKLGSGHVW